MTFIYRAIIYLYRLVWYSAIATIQNHLSIKANGVSIEKGFTIRGFIYFNCHKMSRVQIGKGFMVNSGFLYNHIGRQQTTSIIAKRGALIMIGRNVGMSASAIVAFRKVVIGDNVRIGGNVVIYDSDFHSLVLEERISVPEIKDNIRCKAVYIEDNVFIGAHVTILKGSVIGKNSIIGAGSVVSGEVPANEVWAGNPAKFIKKLFVLS